MNSQSQSFELWDKERRQVVTVVAKKIGSNWLALCNKYDDRKERLSISHEDQLYHCFGCDWKGRLYDSSFKVAGDSRDEMEAVHSYCRADGSVAFQEVRFRGKRFAIRRPCGRDGYTWGLGDEKPIIYNFHLIAKADKDTLIVITEGPKDCDNLMALNELLCGSERFVAATSPFGAGKWREEYSKQLEGFNIVVLYDNDEAGRIHKDQVAKSLKPYAKSIRIVHSKSFALEEKQDISDWLDRDGQRMANKYRLAALLRYKLDEDALPYELEDGDRLALSLREFLSTQYKTGQAIVAEGVIPALGKVIVAGEGGIGKSLLMLQWAIEFTKQQPILGKFEVKRRGVKVLYVPQEGTNSSLQSRLRKMLSSGKELPEGIFIVEPERPQLKITDDTDLQKLISLIQKHQIDVLMLDPL